ncbi:hypothetical protein LJC05_03430 [Bacteroides sp. OttesenSCG-928-J23]|nr:hypothetical protein [Bacteroides sp. OttesenSCG-928-J23]
MDGAVPGIHLLFFQLLLIEPAGGDAFALDANFPFLILLGLTAGAARLGCFRVLADRGYQRDCAGRQIQDVALLHLFIYADDGIFVIIRKMLAAFEGRCAGSIVLAHLEGGIAAITGISTFSGPDRCVAQVKDILGIK